MDSKDIFITLFLLTNIMRWGPAGIPLSAKGKGVVKGIEETARLGLSAMEIEFVRGINMKEDVALQCKKVSKEKDVLLSIHAPYYINCVNEEKFQINRRNIMGSMKLGTIMNATIVVFHPGYYGKLPKEKALKITISTLKKLEKEAREKKYTPFFGPETSGRISALGSLDEIIQICKEVKIARPVIDFAHIHARTQGSLKKQKDFEKIFEKIERELGKKYLRGMHCHFSEIRYGPKGELSHLNLGESNSPNFRILAKVLVEHNYDFTIICETNLLERDALKMKKIYEGFLTK